MSAILVGKTNTLSEIFEKSSIDIFLSRQDNERQHPNHTTGEQNDQNEANE